MRDYRFTSEVRELQLAYRETPEVDARGDYVTLRDLALRLAPRGVDGAEESFMEACGFRWSRVEQSWR